MRLTHLQSDDTSPSRVVAILRHVEYSIELLGLVSVYGGGLINNLTRVVPDHLCLNINLSNIKTLKIFKWLKTKNIKDSEMINTFNCGVGFCVIVSKKNVNKVKKYFSKNFQPYEIGFISKNRSKAKVLGKIKW